MRRRPAAKVSREPASTPRPELVFRGLGVSDGVAIGRAVVLETRIQDVYRFHLAAEDVDAEVARFRQATDEARAQIIRTRGQVGEELGTELAGIFDAHGLLLADASFLDRIVQRIRGEKVNAEWAVHRTAEELAERFARIETEHLRERGQDVLDVSRYLLRSLQGIDHHELSEIGEDVVIIADDITPSEAVRLGREQVVGFAVETGGRTSHTTIIARSLALPAVIGLAEVTSLVTDDDPVIVDGRSGRLILHPTAATMAAYRALQLDMAGEETAALALREVKATTRDGVEVALMANVDLVGELGDARAYGAAGVGLYRSEFLYIERYPAIPTEEEHFQTYREVVEASAPYPAIIRTYDLGGRKLAREVMDTHEDNPVLGLRGIRLMLARQQLFRPQLRALLRAAAYGDLWIMIPMVTTVEEVRQFRSLVRETAQELTRDGVPFGREYKLGIMIEVPAAAVIADLLAREVDFFSLGTNDLIQYALAVDRNNEHVQSLYQPLHPAMVRMLRFVARSAAEAGIELSMCGEMAGDPRFTPLLLALGLRRLSVNPRQIPAVKTQILALAAGDVVGLADRCAGLATAADVDSELARLASSLPPTTRKRRDRVAGRPRNKAERQEQS